MQTVLEKLKDQLKEFVFLTPKELLQLAAIIKFKQVAKGEHIVKVGQYNYNAIRVLRGLLSHYVVDEHGFEKTMLFVPEKNNSGALQTIMNQKAADENIVALENSLLLTVDIRELEKLAAENIKILKFLNQNYKQVITEAAERIKFLIVHSPEERYLHFCSTYPDLEQRVKQKDLASYLGITVSSLSRLRARISKKK